MGDINRIRDDAILGFGNPAGSYAGANNGGIEIREDGTIIVYNVGEVVVVTETNVNCETGEVNVRTVTSQPPPDESQNEPVSEPIDFLPGEDVYYAEEITPEFSGSGELLGYTYGTRDGSYGFSVLNDPDVYTSENTASNLSRLSRLCPSDDRSPNRCVLVDNSTLNPSPPTLQLVNHLQPLPTPQQPSVIPVEEHKDSTPTIAPAPVIDQTSTLFAVVSDETSLQQGILVAAAPALVTESHFNTPPTNALGAFGYAENFQPNTQASAVTPNNATPAGGGSVVQMASANVYVAPPQQAQAVSSPPNPTGSQQPAIAVRVLPIGQPVMGTIPQIASAGQVPVNPINAQVRVAANNPVFYATPATPVLVSARQATASQANINGNPLLVSPAGNGAGHAEAMPEAATFVFIGTSPLLSDAALRGVAIASSTPSLIRTENDVSQVSRHGDNTDHGNGTPNGDANQDENGSEEEGEEGSLA